MYPLLTINGSNMLQIPIAKNGIFWNGRPDEFNNIGGSLDYSQKYGMTAYAKTGAYGYYNGELRPHNGHDFSGGVGTQLVAPIDCRITYTGYDKKGYGNFVFFEAIGMEYVLAHMCKIECKKGDDLKKGDKIGLMGNTGMSTGSHTHFAGRPKGISTDSPHRGYVDLTPFFTIKPIYNKQELYNNQMKLIKKDNDIYAIDNFGKANLILNWGTYQKGLLMGIWEDNVEEVSELPELNQIIILTPND